MLRHQPNWWLPIPPSHCCTLPQAYRLPRVYYLIFCTILLNFSVAFAQTDCTVEPNGSANDPWNACCYLNGNPCQANDFTVNQVILTDQNGVELGSCIPGTPETAYLTLEFVANTSRNALRFYADVYIGGVYDQTINTCFADAVPGGTSTITIQTSINWICGEAVTLENFVIAWTTNGNCASNTPAQCNDYPNSKCYLDQSFPVVTPPVSNFTFQCSGFRTITFTNTSSGDDIPLSYVWDFGDGSPTSTATNPVHTFPGDGPYIVMLTTTDNGGQTSTISYSVDPGSCCLFEVTCSPIIDNGIYNCNNPIPTAADTEIEIEALGWVIGDLPCGSIVVLSVTAPVDVCNTTSVVRTYTIFDDLNSNQLLDNNEDSETCQITYNYTPDNTPPTLTCPTPTTVNAQCAIPAAFATLTGSDNCDPRTTYPVTSSVTPAVPTSGCADGTYVRTYSATDACNNTGTCSQTIVLDDNIAPTLTCPTPTTVNAQCALPAAVATLTGSDNCDPRTTYPVTSSVAPAVPTSGCIDGTYVRTYSATDACNNTGTCSQTIVLDDNIAPTLTCPASVTTGLQCALPAAVATLTGSDNCDPRTTYPVTVTVSPAVPTSGCADGTYVRTYSATDACNNTGTCSQTIVLDDNIAPTLTCPTPTTINAQCALPAAFATLTGTDNCDPRTTYPVTSSVTPAVPTSGCADGTYVRTYSATDACNNTGTCSQTIILDDNIAPTLTCPASVTTGLQCALPAAVATLTGSDNCDPRTTYPVTVTVSPTVPTSGCLDGTYVRTYRATDACNNTGSCTQTIVIDDNIPPTLTCPASVTTGLQCALPAAATSLAGTDNCDPRTSYPVTVMLSPSIPTSGCTDGTYVRTYSATDACNNTGTCSQTIVLDDNIAPTLTCPASVTTGLQCALPAAVATLTGSDNCDPRTTYPVTSSVSPAVPTSGCADGTYVRTYSATDACNNTGSCTQTIVLDDNVAPTLTCPTPTTVNAQCALPAAVATLSGTDNCDPRTTYPVTVTVSPSVPTSGCLDGTYVRTYRATDACNNTGSCTQTIVIDDNTPPSLTCPVNITTGISCASQVPAANIASVTGVSDNCTGNAVTVTHVGDAISGQTCVNRFTITRTYRATDICTNSATCSQIIIVNDQTPPSLTCPASITTGLQCASQVPPASIASVTGVSDNCTGNAVTINHVGDVVSAQTCVNRFTLTRTYRATDVCSNSATCSQIIQVFDNQAPVFNNLPPLTQQVSCSDPLPTFPNVSATDNCGGTPTITFNTWTTQKQGACVYNYTIWYRWRAIDLCGNMREYTASVYVSDQTPPVISNVPTDVIGSCYDGYLFDDVEVEDNCGPASVQFTYNYTCEPGVIHMVRTWTARDRCGNTSTAQQHVTAYDTTPPMPMGVPDDITVNSIAEVPPLPAPSWTVWGCDECWLILNVDVTFRQEIFTDKILRMYQFCDCAGNCMVDTQTITIIPPASGLRFINIPPLNGNPISCLVVGETMGQVQAEDIGNNHLVPVQIADSIVYNPCNSDFELFCKYTATSNDGQQTITMWLGTPVSGNDCIPVEYCPQTTQSAEYQWIENVEIGDFSHSSGATPYADYSNLVYPVMAGGNYLIRVTPASLLSLNSYNWVAWLDLNHDGQFADDESERLLLGTTEDGIAGTLQIPVACKTGHTRLRIAMVSSDLSTNACQTDISGEVEDYTLDIKGLLCPPEPCEVEQDMSLINSEFITLVRMAANMNSSGASQYTDYRQDVTFRVNKGSIYGIRLMAGTSGVPYAGQHHWHAYADFNRDGDFEDANELVVNMSSVNTMVTNSVVIPSNANPGLTTFRVVLSRNPLSDDCDQIAVGEVEDYAMYIRPIQADSALSFTPDPARITPRDYNSVISDVTQWDLAPNPATDQTNIRIRSNQAQQGRILIYNQQGRLMLEQQMDLMEGINTRIIQTASWPSGVYSIHLQDGHTVSTKQLIISRL
jgi:hypothetical protein